jgi:hypothetical protein
MTFEEWQATRRAAAGLERDILEDHFGYVPAYWLTVYVYDGAGVLCSLRNGQYFTHIGRSEYTGTLGAVERRLWDDYAKHEVG